MTEPRGTYEQLWREAVVRLKSGRIQVDPCLRKKAGDSRRGITLVARPDAGVRKKVANFIREAATLYPRQHFYKLRELHLTVMAIISGSVSWRDEIHRLPACQGALEQVLRNARPFRVDFRGVTVSPDAVMIQGFPADNVLPRLRDEIRDDFREAGLGGNLDRRFKTVTAHLTVMRFSRPETDWKRLIDFLQAHRETDFGKTHFQSLQLIWSNWYASAGIVRVLQEYPLKD